MPNNTPWTRGKITTAIIAAVVPLLVSVLLGVFYKPDSWFRNCLIKPCFMPPGWAFGLAWTILYPLLGIAMVAACFESDQPASWTFPVINIIVSLMFSPVMFFFHSVLGGGLITLISLMMGIGLIIQYSLSNESALAAGLMAPYVVWLLIANVLIWYIWFANPSEQRVSREACRGGAPAVAMINQTPGSCPVK